MRNMRNIKQIQSHLLSTRAYKQVHSNGPVLAKLTVSQLCVPSGFRREVAEIGALLGYYAALSDKSLPTFRVNLSARFSRIKNRKGPLPLKMVPIVPKSP